MISLDASSSVPIYEQIVTYFKQLIQAGVLEANQKMPSVRALATQLVINPNTIQHAYQVLESEGYIYSVPAKGNYVAQGISELAKQELLRAFDEMIIQLSHAGLTKQELVARIEGKANND